jgi:hypothetical protein
MALTVAELDAAIDALALGAESYTLPNGMSVQRTKLQSLLELRKLRKEEETGASDCIVPQQVCFP